MSMKEELKVQELAQMHSKNPWFPPLNQLMHHLSLPSILRSYKAILFTNKDEVATMALTQTSHAYVV